MVERMRYVSMFYFARSKTPSLGFRVKHFEAVQCSPETSPLIRMTVKCLSGTDYPADYSSREDMNKDKAALEKLVEAQDSREKWVF